MSQKPPGWADHFLGWYCNPDLLEEIQGDAHELYGDRLKKYGKRAADLKYWWDVLRFFRWSNIKRTEYLPGSIGAIWNLNFKMTIRNAGKNKLLFGIKTIGLSVCLAFALLLTAFVANELTFDRFHANHDRIYRIVHKVQFQDHTTTYAVSPLPVGEALAEGIPEIENYFRFMYEEKPVFRIGDAMYYDEVTLAADSNFLKILTFDFLKGNRHALDEPDKIVLTEALARKFFGDDDPLGQTVVFGQNIALEVAAVIRNVPSNSHLQFSALISWDTFDRHDDWDNLNAYTYLLLRPDAAIAEVRKKTAAVLDTFVDQITRDYQATFEPILQRITDIHFSEALDEDIAVKSNRGMLLTLMVVVVLFLITGLINYLNLTLAELTTNLRKIGIIRVFGGMAEGHRKMLTMESCFTLLVVVPLAFMFGWLGWVLGASYLGILIDPSVLLSPFFVGITIGFLLLLLASTRVNAYVLGKTNDIIYSLKGKFSSSQTGIPVRKVLVAAQLSFSMIVIALIIIISDQFHFIAETDKGFDDHNVVVIKLRDNESSRVDAFSEAIRRVNGVLSVEGSSYYPGVIEMKYVFQIETDKGMEQRLVPMMHCSYAYLDALNVQMVKGRGFKNNSTEDLYHAFIINETAAREFGWKDGVGKKIRGPVTGQGEAYRDGEVIGVVRDFNFASLHNKIEPLIIFPTDAQWGGQFIYIKVNPLHSGDLISTIGKEFKSKWPEFPFEWEYLDAKYQNLYKADHQIKNVFETGLVISILISCLGIFSISALLVTLRTKEMGIRKVVGASLFQLLFLHAKTFIQMLSIAFLVSWPMIWYLSDTWLQSFAYHIRLNIWYFILPGVMAGLITLITSGYHGIRSAMVNPVETLKYE